MDVLKVLETRLDLAAARQACAAANLANAETPGYRRFEAVLREAEGRLPLACTHPAHLPGKGGGETVAVIRDMRGPWRVDGNNVDVDAELAGVVRNQVLYSALTRAVSQRLALARLAATEGRR
ncbi:flagellar basal-body rod protein FlgB [Thermanaeromonas toyohensis ToBE]|uniref:Flagellar basal body rod protein FlgB n=1 Tax=Thermanaeromonas toyohensis ToBE TaxID=698762 RepID=A0A1W1VT67_9FIRM|nr:flagellar basal body rod protein FlgB [Thermanaeromonas toyohensis]SMB96548.1 flagellar basal-body rod protein FlgB [Thermanaeromonas toyohensis ToBE]